jgi:hypothetical protein
MAVEKLVGESPLNCACRAKAVRVGFGEKHPAAFSYEDTYFDAAGKASFTVVHIAVVPLVGWFALVLRRSIP